MYLDCCRERSSVSGGLRQSFLLLKRAAINR
jgi:hypothetical protein